MYPYSHLDFVVWKVIYKSNNHEHKKRCWTIAKTTFRLGECMTGAGGEGGPRGIFLLILKNKIKTQPKSVTHFSILANMSQVSPPHFYKASNT